MDSFAVLHAILRDQLHEQRSIRTLRDSLT
jgi:hypothetical protein